MDAVAMLWALALGFVFGYAVCWKREVSPAPKERSADEAQHLANILNASREVNPRVFDEARRVCSRPLKTQTLYVVRTFPD